MISRETPFYFDFHLLLMGAEARPTFQAKLKYLDLADRTYLTVLPVDVDKQLGPNLGSGSELREVVRAVERVERSVEKVADAIKNKR